MLPSACTGSPATFSEMSSWWLRREKDSPHSIPITRECPWGLTLLTPSQCAVIRLRSQCLYSVLTAPRRKSSFSIRRDLVRIQSEEHTSELQSPCNLVCRLLLEKKKKKKKQ